MAKKAKLPKGWREDQNAVPLPLVRPWDEFKYNDKALGRVWSLGDVIEGVGLEYVLGALESICDEQAGLFRSGCGDVFPIDRKRAAVWDSIAANLKQLQRAAAQK